MDKKKITSVSNFIEIIEQFQSKTFWGKFIIEGNTMDSNKIGN